MDATTKEKVRDALNNTDWDNNPDAGGLLALLSAVAIEEGIMNPMPIQKTQTPKTQGLDLIVAAMLPTLDDMADEEGRPREIRPLPSRIPTNVTTMHNPSHQAAPATRIARAAGTRELSHHHPRNFNSNPAPAPVYDDEALPPLEDLLGETEMDSEDEESPDTPEANSSTRESRGPHRTLEERKRLLETDPWIVDGTVEPKTVLCKGCMVVKRLDKRNDYYPDNFVKHRKRCREIRRALKDRVLADGHYDRK